MGTSMREDRADETQGGRRGGRWMAWRRREGGGRRTHGTELLCTDDAFGAVQPVAIENLGRLECELSRRSTAAVVSTDPESRPRHAMEQMRIHLEMKEKVLRAPRVNIFTWVFCMSWCADCVFRVIMRTRSSQEISKWPQSPRIVAHCAPPT